MIDPLIGIGVGAAGLTGSLAAYYCPAALRILWLHRAKTLTKQRQCVALTFDDGPGPTLTPRILDLLQGHNARATFYVLGIRAEKHPELVRRAFEEGHEIATHTYTHLHAWKSGPFAQSRDIRAGFKTVASCLQDSPPPLRFRPTYGKLTLAGWLTVCRRASAIDWWTIDSCDTKPLLPEPGSIVERIERNGGGVVLLHDHDRQVNAEKRAAYVLAVTDLICTCAPKLGLQCVPMSEALGHE